MVVGCSLLVAGGRFVDCSVLLFVVCDVLFVVWLRCSFVFVCCLFFVKVCSLCVVRCVLFVMCCSLSVDCCVLFVV